MHIVCIYMCVCVYVCVCVFVCFLFSKLAKYMDEEVERCCRHWISGVFLQCLSFYHTCMPTKIVFTTRTSFFGLFGSNTRTYINICRLGLSLSSLSWLFAFFPPLFLVNNYNHFIRLFIRILQISRYIGRKYHGWIYHSMHGAIWISQQVWVYIWTWFKRPTLLRF